MKKDSLAEIRKAVEESIGKKVVLTADKGRKRIVVREGILESAYPSLFVVRVKNEFQFSRRVSYTYSDILTGTVEVEIADKIKEEEREEAKIG